MSATATASPAWDWRPWIIGLGLLLAIPVGKLWELLDRGDGRGDMAEATEPGEDLTGQIVIVDSVTGQDSSGRDGLSVSQAWATVPYALTRCTESLPQCRIGVLDGSTFIDSITIGAANSGTDQARTIIEGIYEDTSDNTLQAFATGSGNGRGALPLFRGEASRANEVISISGAYITLRAVEVDWDLRPNGTATERDWAIEVTGQHVTIEQTKNFGWNSYANAVVRFNDNRLGAVECTGGCGHLTLRDNHFRHHSWQSIKGQDAQSNFLIERNVCDGQYSDCMRWQSNGDNNLTARFNTFGVGGRSDAFQWNMVGTVNTRADNRYHALHHNLTITGEGTAENAYDHKGVSKIAIFSNAMWGGDGDNDGSDNGEPPDRNVGATISKGGGDNSAQDQLVRHNVIYDSSGGVLMVCNGKTIQNTIVNNHRDYTGPNSDYRFQNGFNQLNNNFVHISALTSCPTTAPEDVKRMYGNINVHNEGAAVVSAFQGHLDGQYNVYFDGNGWYQGANLLTLAEWQGSSGTDSDAIEQDPQFALGSLATVNGPYNPAVFELGVGSPARGRVPSIARTTSSGSGTTVPVDDACLFYPGYGWQDEEYADRIQIGAGGNSVQITGSGCYAGGTGITHTLTLSESRSWGNNDPILITDANGVPHDDAGACNADGAGCPRVGSDLLTRYPWLN